MIASLNEILYFIEVANTLNISRASERIGISQPSLSAAIKRLEESIGTPLFMRNKTGVTLTAAGKRLLSHAKQLLQLWETVKAESLASHHEVQGSISLGCHSSVALFTLTKFLPNLLNDYPKLDIRLQHNLSRKILEGVINLSIDIGIVVNPVRHPDLIMQKLYEDKVTFWHSTDYSDIKKKLNTNNIPIICDPELIQTQWLLKQLNKTGIKNYRAVTSSNLEVIAHLTAKSESIGVLPTSVALATFPKKLKAIAHTPVYNDEIFLIYRHENRGIKAVQTIAKTIKACCMK
jgi:DNA-binding transcriptional LysR family regulator